jgi:hypothetical protein
MIRRWFLGLRVLSKIREAERAQIRPFLLIQVFRQIRRFRLIQIIRAAM